MKGYLLLHGFAGSPDDLGPLPEMLKKDGGTLHCPLLAGHGSGRDHMKSATWKDWVASAENALDQLKPLSSEVNVIGFSMGALIGVVLARHHPVDRLVLLSPPTLPNPRELFRGMTDVVKGQLKATDSAASMAYLKEYFRRLTRSPMHAINELYELIKAVEPLYDELEVPTLILQGQKDDLTHPKGARRIHSRLPAREKKLVLLPRSRHLICADCEVDRVMEEIRAFLALSPQTPKQKAR
ncbi:carboxylesterase [Melghirimyces profundicolus]|uniref:Carboxylesterase n=1 Tax=Melghirimyces profundicolus TaxID=1242148 RepID=A0A2T6BU69_9BACL|nr:alpha/beta fold hydrolase [Melghirimyces profundicolus]PTX59604.1 carboxylesterase [Melghirimyces profundicolus]